MSKSKKKNKKVSYTRFYELSNKYRKRIIMSVSLVLVFAMVLGLFTQIAFAN